MNWVALILGLWLTGCSTFPESGSWSAQRRIITLMLERLEVSKEVAWTKYKKAIPIYDAKREEGLLQKLVSGGAEIKLPESDVRKFFTAQMLASRLLQKELIEHWKAGGVVPSCPPKELKTEIRPRLNQISHDLLVELSKAGDWSPAAIEQAAACLEGNGYSMKVVTVAVGCLPKLP